MYNTRDIYLSAYLTCLEYELLKTEVDGKGVTNFYFEDKAENEKELFYSRSAQVEPIQYSIAMKMLKTKIFENKKTYVKEKIYK